jgi:hypothetical protein
MTVVITWMDGKQEVYTCRSASITDGVLCLGAHPSGLITVPDGLDRHFPIAKIRTWTTENH